MNCCLRPISGVLVESICCAEVANDKTLLRRFPRFDDCAYALVSQTTKYLDKRNTHLDCFFDEL